MTSEPLLRFEKVTRRYPRQESPAVERVSLEVAAGEWVGLLGESGSGKTTLLRLAAGLESPDGGSIWLNGTCVAGPERNQPDLPPESRHLGLVFQDGALFPHLNAAKNIAYGMRERDDRRVEECLEMVGLPGCGKRFPHEFSGGERQRIALARALAPRPRLLLLDEPFSHLDAALRRSLRLEMRELLSQLEQTVLLVTHDAEDIFALASRVAIVEKGKVIQVGAPSRVYRSPVSRYAAERFGVANRVETSDGVEWRRPEEARWLGPDSGKGGSRVRVIEVHQRGHQQEVTLAPLDQTGEWIGYLPRGVEIEPGIEGRVRWEDD